MTCKILVTLFLTLLIIFLLAGSIPGRSYPCYPSARRCPCETLTTSRQSTIRLLRFQGWLYHRLL